MSETDADHPGQGLTRREVLVAGAVVGAGAALGASALAAADDPSWAAGTVESLARDEFVLRPADGSQAVRVVLRSDTVVIRDGAATLEAFSVGDEVVVLGSTREGGVIAANRLEPMFRLVRGEVSGRDDDRIVVRRQGLRLTDETVVHNGAHESLEAGDRVKALGQLNPGTGVIDVAIIDVLDR